MQCKLNFARWIHCPATRCQTGAAHIFEIKPLNRLKCRPSIGWCTGEWSWLCWADGWSADVYTSAGHWLFGRGRRFPILTSLGTHQGNSRLSVDCDVQTKVCEYFDDLLPCSVGPNQSGHVPEHTKSTVPIESNVFVRYALKALKWQTPRQGHIPQHRWNIPLWRQTNRYPSWFVPFPRQTTLIAKNTDFRTLKMISLIVHARGVCVFAGELQCSAQKILGYRLVKIHDVEGKWKCNI